MITVKIQGANGIEVDVPDAVATGMITAGLATQAYPERSDEPDGDALVFQMLEDADDPVEPEPETDEGAGDGSESKPAPKRGPGRPKKQ